MPEKSETGNILKKQGSIPMFIRQVKEGRKLTNFVVTPQMSTYLVTIAILETALDSTLGDDIKIHYAMDNIKVQFNVTQDLQVIREAAKSSDRFLRNYTDEM